MPLARIRYHLLEAIGLSFLGDFVSLTSTRSIGAHIVPAVRMAA